MDGSISVIRPCLDDMTKDEICYCVSRFITEVVKRNGADYPPATLYELVMCLQLYLQSKGQMYRFLQDDSFIQLKHTLDNVMKERAEKGLSNGSKQAEVITLEEEELLWKRGVLGNDNPKQLVDTVLYLLGLNFALRAGQEHRNLRWENSQLSIMTDSRGLRCLRYREDVSKTNQGGLKHRRVKRKIVYAYEDGTNPDRCIIRLFQLYDKYW